MRLSRSLPPLPLDELPPRAPYRDNPLPLAVDTQIESSERSQPPDYEPMYDYLRSQNLPAFVDASQYTLRHSIPDNSIQEPYRDEPFIVTIDESGNLLPPPSYDDSQGEVQNQETAEDMTLMTRLDLEANHMEDIFKFLLVMLMIALTVGAVGIAFSWGSGDCQSPSRC